MIIPHSKTNQLGECNINDVATLGNLGIELVHQPNNSMFL